MLASSYTLKGKWNILFVRVSSTRIMSTLTHHDCSCNTSKDLRCGSGLTLRSRKVMCMK